MSTDAARPDRRVGDIVAERTYPLTRDSLVRYAGASGDFNPIHYRDDVAAAVGLPGVLAHGMLTMGTRGAAGRRLARRPAARSSTTRCGSPARSSSTRRRRASVTVVAKVGVRRRRRRPHRPHRHLRRGRPCSARRRCGSRLARRVTLSELTTLRVGGPADAHRRAATRRASWSPPRATPGRAATSGCVLGGGSNVVIADEGFDGTVIRVATRGIERLDGRAVDRGRRRPPAHAGDRTVRLRVQAGEPWDDLVAARVENGLGGDRGALRHPGFGRAPRRSRTSARTARSSAIEPRRHRLPRLPDRRGASASRPPSSGSATAPRALKHGPARAGRLGRARAARHRDAR